MPGDTAPIFSTPRLTIRLAVPGDVEFFHQLWTDARVMVNVGFPGGLPISRAQIERLIEKNTGSEFDHLLVVTLKTTGQAFGECKMGLPDPRKVASTDVKLLPAFWGNHYGVEVKQGLLDYLFTHTDCEAVEASPNQGNIASIKMQEAVGGVRLGEGHFEFPAAQRSYTTPVDCYIYQVSRQTWLERQHQAGQFHQQDSTPTESP